MLKKQLSFLFVIIIIMFSLCSCKSSNLDNGQTNLPKETIALTEENIDEYLYYTYIYTFNNLTEKRREYYETHSADITYSAYIIEINFYPKKQNIKFENCIITLGRFVTLPGTSGVYCNDDYTYTVYVDENGNGQYRNQVWVRGAWEKEAFTKKYYNIQGNVLIY